MIHRKAHARFHGAKRDSKFFRNTGMRMLLVEGQSQDLQLVFGKPGHRIAHTALAPLSMEPVFGCRTRINQFVEIEMFNV